MTKKTLLSLSVSLIALIGLALPFGVAARAPQPQITFQTPTPGPDGRIIYKVKGGDTCISISLLSGVSTEELRKLNNLNTNCDLQAGTDLLLGIVGPPEVTPTPGPSATATALLPTPTPFTGTGKVCIVLYEDLNGDGQRQMSERVIPDGAVSLNDPVGAVSLTGITTPSEELLCFNEVEEGDYTVSVAVPERYNPTTTLNYLLPVKAGDQALLGFGAQLSSEAAPLPPSEGGRNPLLGILGGLLLLAGAGLGVYMVWFRPGK